MKTYIGIDPGKSGGIAVIDSNGRAYAHKMPETERDILDALMEVHKAAGFEKANCRAALEFVRTMPQNGVRASFSFGMSYGGLRMALIAAGIPFVEVLPRKWQATIGCMTGGDKNVSKAKAQEMFPDQKITHAIADALLIAEWLRRTSK